MSEIEVWLDEKAEDLAGIAAASDLSPDLVTMVAIFVLAGHSDAAIRHELWPLEPRFGTHDPATAAKLGRALHDVRAFVGDPRRVSSAPLGTAR